MTTPRSAALSAILAMTSLCAALASQGKTLEWHRDLTAARELAAKTNRPLFLVFRCER